MPPRFLSRCLGFLFSFVALTAFSLAVDDASRVPLRMNPGGSKRFIKPTVPNGRQPRPLGNAWQNHLQTGRQGRYESGQVFAADGKLRFKTQYRYETTRRLAEEIRLGKDDSVRNRILYSYGAKEHQLG